MLSRIIKTPPSYFPVSLAQAKKHLNIYHANHDEYIRGLIATATYKAQQVTRRRLVAQTWKVFLQQWPCGDILLPYGALQSVAHVKYKNQDGSETVWDSSSYIVNTDIELGRIVLAASESYPSDTLYPTNPIEIEFTCGFGGFTPKVITLATNATPIVATIGGHGYSSGDTVYVSGGTGLTAINGTWPISKLTDDTFELNGSVAGADGYIANSATCIKQSMPSNITHAIMLMVSDYYEQREDIVTGTISRTLKMANRLLIFEKLHEIPTDAGDESG